MEGEALQHPRSKEQRGRQVATAHVGGPLQVADSMIQHGCLPMQDVTSYRMEALVRDVAGVIRAVAPPASGRVALGGHDWGGYVAWHVAHVHPGLVDRLVVMCAPHPRRILANFDLNQSKRCGWAGGRAAGRRPGVGGPLLCIMVVCHYEGLGLTQRGWGLCYVAMLGLAAAMVRRRRDGPQAQAGL